MAIQSYSHHVRTLTLSLMLSLLAAACAPTSGGRSSSNDTTSSDAVTPVSDVSEPSTGDTATDTEQPMPDAPEPILDSVEPMPDVSGPDPVASAGCGLSASHPAGGTTVTINASAAGDGQRGFYLSLPADYDSNVPARLIIGYPGTNWIGEQIQPYLDLESEHRPNEIFVYPDPLWRDFPGWGNLGGWVLGPNAAPANGSQDLVFTEALLTYMSDNYCIDQDRIFATGHSWGGDMAMVVSCFQGDLFRATVPVAANRPYWFEEPGGGWTQCVGETAVWSMFGLGDDHFTWQDFPGQFGDEVRDFWLQERDCDGPSSTSDLGYGALEESVEFSGCSANTRYSLYGTQTGHQIPSYFSEATMTYFRSF
jgi:polyhydroxybutyrate depolymerase